MSKSQKFVSLADVVTNLADDPKVKAIFAKELKLKKESPARHERKFNLDLMNLSMEINFYCQQIGYITNQVLSNSNEYTEQEIDEMFAQRQKTIFDLARVQQKHDELVRKLDSEIVLEDFQKKNKK